MIASRRGRTFVMATLLASGLGGTGAQMQPAGTVPQAHQEGDAILGGYGPYRANNHLLHYNLHVRVDVAKKFISGMNAIQFRMLEDGTRIQLDLVPTFAIDGIVLETAHGAPTPLKYNRV